MKSRTCMPCIFIWNSSSSTLDQKSTVRFSVTKLHHFHSWKIGFHLEIWILIFFLIKLTFTYRIDMAVQWHNESMAALTIMVIRGNKKRTTSLLRDSFIKILICLYQNCCQESCGCCYMALCSSDSMFIIHCVFVWQRTTSGKEPQVTRSNPWACMWAETIKRSSPIHLWLIC